MYSRAAPQRVRQVLSAGASSRLARRMGRADSDARVKSICDDCRRPCNSRGRGRHAFPVCLVKFWLCTDNGTYKTPAFCKVHKARSNHDPDMHRTCKGYILLENEAGISFTFALLHDLLGPW